MNLDQLFGHWRITENPFRGEEARHDSVFARMNLAAGTDSPPAGGGNVHSDFDKILGELVRPTTSIVFGEKGSGKTAIRLQIADRVARHNAARPESRLMIVSYDDLNPLIDELRERHGKSKDELAAFRACRLVDHMDQILSLATGKIVAGLLGEGQDRDAADLSAGGVDGSKRARKMPVSIRRDLMLLQAVYDPASVDGERSSAVRQALRLPAPGSNAWWELGAFGGWAPPAALFLYFQFMSPSWFSGLLVTAVQSLVVALLVAWVAAIVKVAVMDRVAASRKAAKIHAEMRGVPRPASVMAASLRHVPAAQVTPAEVPMTDGATAPRYAAFERLRRVLGRFGYSGMLVLLDRLDEPTLVNGDEDRMRLLVWPLLSAKFLQQDGLGVKMLLPIELRYALFRESSSFFQEARLDKQSLIERLTWTGPMLYDLCSARLHACREPGAEPMTLHVLFAEDVTRQDLVDALDQMHQPRDAFKFLYRCLKEHCSNVTAEDGAWRVPRAVLEQVRRAEADRVQQLHRGVRPA